jgi:hypothetical protein
MANPRGCSAKSKVLHNLRPPGARMRREPHHRIAALVGQIFPELWRLASQKVANHAVGSLQATQASL